MVDLVGEENSIWLWKANEADVVAFVVPLFWDFVATRRRKDGTIVTRSTEDVGDRVVRRVVWDGGLILILACMEGPMFEAIFGDRLPQRVLTFPDVFAGLLVLSVYFDWSRGFWRSSGPRLVSAGRGLGFWVAVLLANIAIYQDPVKDLLGADNASTLDFHAEALAVCLLVQPLLRHHPPPHPRRRSAHGARCPGGTTPWPGTRRIRIVLMAVLLWIGQGRAFEWSPDAFGQWFVRQPRATDGSDRLHLLLRGDPSARRGPPRQQDSRTTSDPGIHHLICPEDDVTRGQMAIVIARAYVLPATTVGFFTDDAGKVYQDAANRLAAHRFANSVLYTGARGREPEPLWKGRKRLDRDHFEEVARVYRQSYQSGKHPTQEVAEHFGIGMLERGEVGASSTLTSSTCSDRRRKAWPAGCWDRR